MCVSLFLQLIRLTMDNRQNQNNNQVHVNLNQRINNLKQWIRHNLSGIVISVLSILVLLLSFITFIHVPLVSQEDCSTLEIQGGLPYLMESREDFIAMVQYINQEGNPCSCTKAMNATKCNLQSEMNKEKEQCAMKKINDEHFEIIFSSEHEGIHELSVEVDGKHIKGSPFTLVYLNKFGAELVPLSTITEVTAPQGMTFNQTGALIVVEYRVHRVTIFDRFGKKLLSLGSEGSEPGQLYYPCDVAVDGEGNILVADGRNNRIQKFSPEGKYITAVGKHGTKPMEFDFPVGIGIHPHTKKIYVTENKNNRIQVLNPDLTFSGNIAGQFNEPKDVAFDSHGNVYVADNEHHQIQVFTAEGQYLRRFGKEGKKPGELNYPSSIAINKDDILYVLELYNYRVSVFTCTGKFLKSFGLEGHGPGQFKEARGIAVDTNGNVYVSDRGNDCIQVF